MRYRDYVVNVSENYVPLVLYTNCEIHLMWEDDCYEEVSDFRTI